MDVTYSRDDVLAWFTGKEREQAAAALDRLERSSADGYWSEGASREVEIALSKSKVARKVAEADQPWLDSFRCLPAVEVSSTRVGQEIHHCMTFGLFRRIQAVDFSAAMAAAHYIPKHATTIGSASSYATAFAPVARACDELDATCSAVIFPGTAL